MRALQHELTMINCNAITAVENIRHCPGMTDAKKLEEIYRILDERIRKTSAAISHHEKKK